MQAGRSPADRTWIWVVGLFFVLGLAGILHHEMWRDELEIWLLARDSASLPQLFANIGTQEHPPAWYLLAFGLARLSGAPLALQILNLLIGTAAVLVVFRCAPFSTLQRLLFCFGYYALYEFTIIARSYALELLLACGACALFARRRRIGAGMAALLVLLAHTNFYGTVIAGLIVLLLLLRAWRDRSLRELLTDRRQLLALIVALAGVASAFGLTLLHTMAVGAAHREAYVPGLDLPWLLSGLSTVSFGFLPLPDPTTPHSWNSSFLALLPGTAAAWVGGLLGAALLAWGGCCLRRHWPVLLAFLAGSGAMLGISLFVWYGYQRHHGQLFVWLLLCCWLAHGLRRDGSRAGDDSNAGAACSAGLTALLAIQLIAGAYAYARDLARPFSHAEAAGSLLSAAEFDRALLLGSVDYAVQPIAAYVDRPIYYPESGRFGTFLDWSDARRMVSFERVLEEAVGLARRERREVVVVLSYSTGMGLGERADLGQGLFLHHFARFEGAIVPDENYQLFRLGPPPAE